MDHLKSDLQKMISHVQSLPPNPTFEQLETKVRALSEAIQRDTVASPASVKEITYKGFMSMGWSVTRGKVVQKGMEFSVDALIAALQQILDDCNRWTPVLTPSADELKSLSLACDRLWNLDTNRLVPNTDYKLNVQQGKKVYEKNDVAVEPLFAYVDETVFRRPSYSAFISLLDNYEAQLGQSEQVTKEELSENAHFLRLVMDTPVMKYVHTYLLLTGKTKSARKEEFLRDLDYIWFGLYTRKVRNDSSGFEHVFLGEVKEDNSITGFHNWVQFYLEEKKGNVNYLGYIKPRRRSLSAIEYAREHEQFICMQFDWKNARKPASSSLIGCSPEFEIALYTLCFYAGETENLVQLGPYKVLITCHRWRSGRSGDQLATCFPGEPPLDENEAATRIQSCARAKKSRNIYSRR